MSAAMTMMASSRTGKNRSWRRSSRSLTAACAARRGDPAELSGCAAVGRRGRGGRPGAGVGRGPLSGFSGRSRAVSAGAGQDARAIAGSSARGAGAGSCRSAEAEARLMPRWLAWPRNPSVPVTSGRRPDAAVSVLTAGSGAGSAFVGPARPPSACSSPGKPRSAGSAGRGFRLAVVKPGEVLVLSGFGVLGGIRQDGERGVEWPAAGVLGRVVPVGRGDARVGGRVPA